jgi:uncharacterized membrane protein YfcA
MPGASNEGVLRVRLPRMRSIVDFYRQRPAVLAVAVVIGLAVAVATTVLSSTDGVILPVLFVAVVGLLVGSIIGAAQRRRGRDDRPE